MFVCSSSVRWALLAVLCCAAGVQAQTDRVRLSLSEALARARAEAPAMLIARARIEEARGRLAGASVRFQNNPYLDITSGERRTFDGRSTTDLEVGILQMFETGGQRDARVAGASAAIDAEVATSEDTLRQALGGVAVAYLRHQANSERHTLLLRLADAASEVESVANRRFAAGDIAWLERNVARAAALRARASVGAADADLVESSGTLARLLGLPTAFVELVDALAVPPAADLEQLLAAVERRPDLAALRAAAIEADAETRLGMAARHPDIGVGVRGKREGADHALVGVLSFSFPTFNAGQEQVVTGTARAARLRQELQLRRTAIRAEVVSLDREYQHRLVALNDVQRAMPLVDENVVLSGRSYEEGELSLADLLLVRQDAVTTKLAYVDRLYEAAETAVARDAAAGVLR